MNYKERSKAQKARRRFESRDMIQAMKENTPCKDCGSKLHPCQIDIVRKDGTKSIQLSKVLHKSRKFILEELELCDFVCSNCNRLRTWKYQRSMRREFEGSTDVISPEKNDGIVDSLDSKTWTPQSEQ